MKNKDQLSSVLQAPQPTLVTRFVEHYRQLTLALWSTIERIEKFGAEILLYWAIPDGRAAPPLRAISPIFTNPFQTLTMASRPQM
jgi:hypothetical protein